MAKAGRAGAARRGIADGADRVRIDGIADVEEAHGDSAAESTVVSDADIRLDRGAIARRAPCRRLAQLRLLDAGDAGGRAAPGGSNSQALRDVDWSARGRSFLRIGR